MIISRGRRYIFVHIPKTGGTSLALALEAKAMKDDILIGDTPKAKQRRKRLKGVNSAGRLWKHSTLADIDGVVTSAEINDFFIFTIIRNPWDRMVSYYHWLRVQKFEHPHVKTAQLLGFSEFLNAALIGDSFCAAPFGSYVRDSGGKERCDLFLRLENLTSDMGKLEDQLSLKLPAPTHSNKSKRALDYRKYYSSADAEQLAQICAIDIKRFGYKFE